MTGKLKHHVEEEGLFKAKTVNEVDAEREEEEKPRLK